jgi:hypothetical protein
MGVYIGRYENWKEKRETLSKKKQQDEQGKLQGKFKHRVSKKRGTGKNKYRLKGDE